jgi:dTDP-4-dehydrorhamnose reductase
MPRLAWVTGAGGLIGSHLVKSAPPSWRVRGLTRDELDICNTRAVEQQFRLDRPDAIIHCAAISKVQQCDDDPDQAKKVNTDAVVTLAGIAAEIPFIFFSTDLVFDGTKGNYVETDEPNPLSIYGETKIAAERAVLDNPNHTVIRTSLNAGHSPSGDRAFNEQMRAAFKAGRTLSLFEDEFRCPIPAEFTARAILEIVGEPGLFHLCGAERLSRYQIGQLLAANHPELTPKIDRGTLRDYQGAPRSPDTSMNCAKIQSKLSFPLPKFSDWVRAQPPGSL